MEGTRKTSEGGGGWGRDGKAREGKKRGGGEGVCYMECVIW